MKKTDALAQPLSHGNRKLSTDTLFSLRDLIPLCDALTLTSHKVNDKNENNETATGSGTVGNGRRTLFSK
jgi:hypothetical protein